MQRWVEGKAKEGQPRREWGGPGTQLRKKWGVQLRGQREIQNPASPQLVSNNPARWVRCISYSDSRKLRVRNTSNYRNTQLIGGRIEV